VRFNPSAQHSVHPTSGYAARFLSLCLASSFFWLPSRVSSRPLAANANRWAEKDNMDEQYSLSRNLTQGFAQRVRKNLDFIIEKSNDGEDVHVVSQLVTSLLGIIIFPWEVGALHRLEHIRLSELEEEGWPRWNILLDEKGDTETLGKLVRHLRNAASHRRLKFLSDDRALHKVEIEFEDALNKNSSPNWRARINAADLKLFCDQFTEKLEDLVG